jgi:hypothetical protein
MRKILSLTLLFGAAALSSAAPAAPVLGPSQCVDTDGRPAATLSLSVADGPYATLAVPAKGDFPFDTDGGTAGNIQFIDVHNGDNSGPERTFRFAFYLAPKVTELVVTTLPDNKRMTCQIPGRGPR